MPYAVCDAESGLVLTVRRAHMREKIVGADMQASGGHMKAGQWALGLLREPLVHFLVGAGLLFAFYTVLNPAPATNMRTVAVDRGQILSYLQYRARAFDPERAGSALDAMAPADVQELVDAYVREEALYREAKALGLDQADYVTRLRLVQQLELITQGFVDTATEISDEEVRAWFETHRSDYIVPAEITFTHVFFSNERHTQDEMETLAAAKLAELNANEVPFHEAMAHGDRALYFVNYVRKEKDLVASHFGDAMANDLFALSPDETVWQGPYMSPYGLHLVLVTEVTRDRAPPLEEVGGRVAADALAARQRELLDDALREIVGTYNVQLSEDLAPLLSEEASDE